MTILTHVDVGVDISKKHLDFHLYQDGKTLHVLNSKEGIGKVTNLLSQYEVRQIVCESTGMYGNLMCNELRSAGYNVWVVPPQRIKAFGISVGIKVKTDKIDAEMIAAFASKNECPHEYTPLSKDNEKLKELVNLKSSMTAAAAELKTKLQQTTDLDCIKFITKDLRHQEKIIKKLSEQINALIKNNDELKKKANIIRSIDGIGPGTTEIFLALLPELGKVSNKVAAALVGVAPYIKQSGSYKGQAHISGGRSELRKVLYMAALTATTYNPKLKIFYERLRAAGKPFKVAIVAVMRKLVTYMNILVSKGELWNPAV